MALSGGSGGQPSTDARGEPNVGAGAGSLDSQQVLKLVRAARAGSEAALRELIAWAMDYLFPVVLTMLRERHGRGSYVTDVLHGGGPDLYDRMQDDAWEITHLACCRIATRLDSFKGRNAVGQPVQFATWAYAIARNEMRSLMRSRWRERKRRVWGTTDRLDPDKTPAAEAYQVGEDMAVIEKFDVELVREALRKAPLTHEQKQAILLYHGLGYRQERIAAIAGVQVGTVKKRIFDGLRKLRAYVQERSGMPPKSEGRV